MITRDKITEIFCAVDEFCKLYEYETAKSALIDASGRKTEQEGKAVRLRNNHHTPYVSLRLVPELQALLSDVHLPEHAP